jgi:hypothetical protein
MISVNLRYEIDGPDSMTEIAQLNQGRFYWVLVCSSTKDPEWQPARFTGVAGHRAGAQWDFIGFNSGVGHHFVEVVEIGAELTDAADGRRRTNFAAHNSSTSEKRPCYPQDLSDGQQ